MNFSIIGASRETGEDIQTVVPARNRAGAERWAEKNGVLWTQITPVPPQYAAERDGAIWLIGCIAILLSLLIAGPRFNLRDATQLGSFSATVFIAFILVFGFGLIGAKIAGKKARRSRIGFGVTAALIIALFAYGDYRMRLQNLSDATNSGDAIAAALRQSPTNPPSTAHPRAGDPSIGTINDLDSAQAADMKILLADEHKFFAECNAARDEFQNRIKAIGGTGLLTWKNFDTADDIATTKAKLAQVLQTMSERDKKVDELFGSLPARLGSLPIDQTFKQSVMAGYSKHAKQVQQLMHQIATADRDVMNTGMELADFMSGRMGHFTVDDKGVIFDEAADLKTYNGFVDRMRQTLAKENELSQEQQRQAGESADQMRQFLGK